MYVGTDTGVYSSSDGGVTWTPYKTGMPNAQVTQLELDPTTDILAAGTDGRGVYEIGIQETIAVQVTPPVNVTAGEVLNNIAVAQFTDLVAPGRRNRIHRVDQLGQRQHHDERRAHAGDGGGFLIQGSNTYTAAGTYTISVTVQSNNGNSGQNTATFRRGRCGARQHRRALRSARRRGRCSADRSPHSTYANPTATCGQLDRHDRLGQWQYQHRADRRRS